MISSVVIVSFLALAAPVKDVNPFSLDTIPYDLYSSKGIDEKLMKASTNGKLIPRIIWVAVANSSEELPGTLIDVLKRNSGWTVKVYGNEEKDTFISSVFAGTRVEWAYNMLNPRLGAAKADIWRYATLYVYGGFYIDEDSSMRVLLDDIIKPSDTLIVGEDGTGYYDYFRKDFKLSDNVTFSKHKTFGQTTLKYITGNSTKTGYPIFFDGKVRTITALPNLFSSGSLVTCKPNFRLFISFLSPQCAIVLGELGYICSASEPCIPANIREHRGDILEGAFEDERTTNLRPR
jgi:hypothetical protein